MRTDILQQARAIRASMDAAAISLTDEQAANAPRLYPTWSAGMEVKAGDRLYYTGTDKLYKVRDGKGHTTQADWTPDITPAMFVVVSLDEWPEFVQPTGAHDAYNKGDKVTFEGKHYISLIDGNVYSPAAYPAGWQEQE